MTFNYQARTKEGEVQTGTIEASSRETALVLLQRHGLVVTYLEGAEKVPFYAKKLKLFNKVSRKDLVNFSRQLSLMFASKISLIQALQTLAKQTKNPTLQEKIMAISQEIEGGTSFSQALSNYPKIFPYLYVSIIKSGETSGTLVGSLEYLADYLEREYFLFAKIRGAMIYPILILVVMLGVLIMMVYFVIPQISTVLETSGQELPLLTRGVLALSDFFRKFGLLILLPLVGLIIFFFRYIKTPSGRNIWHRILLRLPLIGPFLKMVYVSRFADNLSTLIKSGLPISQALEITSDVVGNQIYRKIILKIRDEVRKGKKISSQLEKQRDFFPPILCQMVTVGEQTGNLDQTLAKVVKFYQIETDRGIDNLLSILEPVLVLFLGLIVALLVASVLIPIYNISSL